MKGDQGERGTPGDKGDKGEIGNEGLIDLPEKLVLLPVWKVSLQFSFGDSEMDET